MEFRNDSLEIDYLNEEDREREKLGYEEHLFTKMKKIVKDHKKILDKKLKEEGKCES